MDLVNEFLALTEDDPTVEIFRRWAAISLVSAALPRKAFSHVRKVKTYANLFVVMVGLPGSGKSIAIRRAQEFALAKFEDGHVAPDSLTIRRLTHIMAYDHEPEQKSDSKKGKRKKGQPVEFTVPKHEIIAQLSVFSSEFGTFLKEYDQDMMKVLSDLFDCPDEYRHETQHFGKDTIYNAYLTILGGVQPWWFGKLPSTAFEQGFMTRLIIVHSEDEIVETADDLFPSMDAARIEQRRTGIEARLEQIQALDGEFMWFPEAKKRFKQWYSTQDEHAPKHPLLSGYRRRRVELLTRLVMVAAASRSGRLEVTLEDVERAVSWLSEAEATMPKALQTAGASPYFHHEIAVAAFVLKEHGRNKKPVYEAAIRRFMARNIPPNLADPVLNGLVAQGRLIVVGDGKSPTRNFLPGRHDEQ